MMGLGSAIEKITKAVGIKTCAGCKKRKEWLDKRAPFSRAKGKEAAKD